jgi:hypothetical protein
MLAIAHPADGCLAKLERVVAVIVARALEKAAAGLRNAGA